MRKVIGLFFQTVKVFILFTICTVLFYYGIIWINEEYENYQRYDEPEGTAIKAFQMEKNKEGGGFGRLMLFYLNGE